MAFHTVFVVGAAGLVGVAVGVAWGLWRVERTRRAVGLLANRLGALASPGTLGPALARSLGDPRLTVAYWLPSSHRYADASGRRVDPAPGPGQVATTITRNGAPVAIVVHDEGLSSQTEIGPAARLAVDNERLRAEILARLDDLRASQSRIVARGDETRRTLERDLHDGAQQRLLAASFELRQARAAATKAGNRALAATLEGATERTRLALDELRALAHGIYPAILTEGGLEPAVRSLAVRTRIPVELLGASPGRSAAVVECTAYAVVAECVDEAAARAASHVCVRIRHIVGALEVRVETGDAGPSMRLLTELADRVGAVGGTIQTRDSILVAVIPCES